MKLNNKGFAVSVILYSITAILVLVLFLILGLNSVNNRNKDSMSDAIKEQLSGLDGDYLAVKSNTIEKTGIYSAGWNNEVWENNGTQYSGYFECPDGSRCLHYRATNISPAYDTNSSTATSVYYDCPFFCMLPYTYYDCESNKTKVGDYCYSCPNGGVLNTTTLMCNF